MARIVLVGSYAKSLTLFRGPLIQEMRRLGHEVIACAPNSDPDVSDELAEMGVVFREIQMSRTGLNPLSDSLTTYNLYRLFRELSPDVFLAYTIKPVIYGSIAARAAGVAKRAAMITGLGYAFSGESLKRQAISWIARKLYKAALSSSDIVYFQNPDDQAAFAALGLLGRETQSVLINGSGVDIDRYAPAELPDKPVFLLVARLLAEKGVREYAEAASILKKRFPNAEFQLIGWIDENPNAVSQRELDTWTESGTVRYLGHVADVRPYLTACSVFTLPSYYPEGTPRTVLEAMAMGRPIITTDSPGCRETVVDGENGFLVPPRDSQALADRMAQLIESPMLRAEMGRKSRLRAVEKYDVHKVNLSILRPLELLDT